MTIDRRTLLHGSAAALLMAWHGQGGFARTATGSGKRGPSGKLAPSHRLRHLRLQTTTPLDEMREFYAGKMEMPVLERSTRELVIGAGQTRLSFVKRPAEQGAPWYHVAFNIPENKILSARDWQLERTPLDNNPRAPRHPEHPDIVHFAHWDAHSVFFRDPAGNLLEHIARHTLDCASPGAFSSRDIACCSEIALVLDDEDLRPAADRIGAAVGLSRYATSSHRFVALGDENGLLLIMRRGVSLRGRADVFATEVEIAADRRLDHRIEGFPYRIMSL